MELLFDFENQILMLPAPNLPWLPSTWMESRLICRHGSLCNVALLARALNRALCLCQSDRCPVPTLCLALG